MQDKRVPQAYKEENEAPRLYPEFFSHVVLFPHGKNNDIAPAPKQHSKRTMRTETNVWTGRFQNTAIHAVMELSDERKQKHRRKTPVHGVLSLEAKPEQK
eukprot:1169980-Amphidinium_carterae.1